MNALINILMAVQIFDALGGSWDPSAIKPRERRPHRARRYFFG